MTTFGVVGGLGIGAAHTIAALNLGWELRWVADINPEVHNRYQPGKLLTNQWGHLAEESATLNDNFKVIERPTQATDVDVVIIATPHWLHDNHLANYGCYGNRVLLEKPALITSTYGRSGAIGHKGLHRADIWQKTQQNPKIICQFHEFPPKRHWADNIMLDLGSHLLAYAMAASPKNIASENITLLHLGENHLAFMVGNILCVGSYSIRDYVSVLHGKSIKTVLLECCDLFIDDTQYIWDDKVFQYQLENVADGNYRTPLQFAAKLDHALLVLQCQRNLIDEHDIYKLPQIREYVG